MWKLSQTEAQFIMNLLSHLLAIAGLMGLLLLYNVWRIKSFAHRGKGSHEAVKECLTTNGKAFASRPSSSAGKLLGYNYAGFGFAPYGPLWREMRKLSVTELLSNRPLNELKHVLVSELDVCIRDLYSLGKETN
ncbi:xanthotoxin 5-hydroxylase CYP82C4-like [Vitis riparia]|uniref:xanthotoxin 5-hydroxylase CYP82C4-like n=1 Tax=Vitis riparia TaxID=96939 RepID=UPI00155A8707|nr:xanthotoxin 5-hydroxylase CYP82C4-like [Vitis riparia]